MNLFEFQEKFPDESAVIQYFIKIRYKYGISCPHCAKEGRIYHRTARPKNFNCRNCDNDFSIFTGTIFENSCTDLRKWFHAINRMSHVGRKGVSALQLQREIGCTYKTCWRMLRLIRTAMGDTRTESIFNAIVEIDETYVGGKPRKGNKHGIGDNGAILPNKRGRGTRKTPVVAVIERNSKRVVARVMLPNKEGKRLSSNQLLDILEEICNNGTTVMTDQFSAYSILDRENRNDMIRLSVDHNKTYVNGNVHTNNVESFWALLKRGLHGVYHNVSVKYLQHYVNEFVFRMNHRTKHAFNVLVCQCISY